MAEQRTFSFAKPARLPRGATIQERFLAFHDANPWVCAELVRLLREAAADGATAVGMKHLYEILRWRHRRATRGAEPFKLSNDFTSRYARLIQGAHPELGVLLQTRALRDGADG